MAKKTRAVQRRRSPKLEPVPLTLTFATAQGAAGVPQVNYIDLSQCASIASRKFFRQGLNWAIAGIKCSSLLPGAIAVYKLPNTWVLSNSWHKSFAVWQRMNNDALEESESVRPRFLDFKIYADKEHHQLGYPANLLPVSIASIVPPVAGVTTAGEWEPSKMIIPDNTNPGFSTEREVTAVGASFSGVGASGLNSVSMIEGYAASRGLPNILDPNHPDDASDADGVSPENWMAAMSNEGTTQDATVLDDMINENNIAPYPFENDGTALDTMYPGGANQMQGMEWHDFAQIYATSATTNVGIARLKGGNVPCGLLRIVWTPTEGTPNLVFQIDMIPGSMRGYLAEPMQDM